jgi:signal transduction histidine kinase
MAKLLTNPDSTENLPTDPQALQAEVLRLRQVRRVALQEEDRALRLLRRTNADLYSQVQGQTRQLSALNQLICAVNTSLDLGVVAATGLTGLQSLVGVEAASLILIDGAGDARYIMGLPHDRMPCLAACKVRKGEGIVGTVMETGRAYVENEIRPDTARLSDTALALGVKIRSVLCQPLQIHDQVSGVVLLANKHAGPFTDSDRAFVETVTASLAIAVENARMYKELETQLRQLERAHQDLVETQAQLVQSAKLVSIGQLAAGLAHEINNPMGIVLGYAQLAKKNATDEKLVTYAETIERETLRVKRIVDDLLGFARQAKTEAVKVDLRQIAEAALGLFEYQLTHENISVNRLYSEAPNWVLIDNNQLLQVMMNLLQNARQAMPTGGQITVRTWNEAPACLFSIADTGTGIPEADLEHIFDPFFTTKPVGQGTGLGLSVSHGIITRHGGTIQVSSRLGQGTTFVIQLPALPDAAAPA